MQMSKNCRSYYREGYKIMTENQILHEMSERYLNPEEPKLYPYRVKVEVKETYYIEVLAVDEADSYDVAETYIRTCDGLEYLDYSNTDNITSCELDEVDVFSVYSEEM